MKDIIFYLGIINKNLKFMDEALDNFKNALIQNKSNVASYIQYCKYFGSAKNVVKKLNI